jgi:hypothetical protein
VGFVVGSDVAFNNCSFYYNYNALVDVIDGYYNASNLVNPTFAMMFNTVGLNGALQNINVSECEFFSVFTNHFPFFSIQLTDQTAYVSNVNILNNAFVSQTTEDIRGVVTFNSTVITAVTGVYPLYPKLVDVNIIGNICNQDQMISISSHVNPSTDFIDDFCAPLTCINCRISNNICGTIGYLTSVNDTADFANAASSSESFMVRNKLDNLSITNNTCKLITNVISSGLYLPFLDFINGFSSVSTMTIGTGQVDINYNICSWIAVGASGTSGFIGQGVRIQSNKLSPTNSNYLAAFTNILLIRGSIDNLGIYLAADFSTVGNTQSIISNNMLVPANILTNTGGTNGPYFYSEGLSINNNAIVTDNIIFDVVTTGSIIAVDTANILVTGNHLKRNGQTIRSYVSPVGNSTTKITIVDNIFDSIFLDAANTILNDTGITGFNPNVLYTRNTNQVSYAAIQLSSFNPSITSNENPGLSSIFVFNGNASPFNNSLSPFTVPVSSILPQGVKLLYVTLGMFDGTITVNAGSSISMSIATNVNNELVTPSATPTTYTTNLTNGGTFAGSIVDIFANQDTHAELFSPASASIPLTSTAHIHDINTTNGSTVYLNMDMTVPATPFFTGREYDITFQLSLTNVTSSSTSSALIMSPLVIRYAFA